MTTPNTVSGLPATQDFKAIATQVAQDLLNQNNSQVAIANKIEQLTSSNHLAQAKASELEAANKNLLALVETEKAEAAKAKEETKKVAKDKDDVEDKFKKAKADLDKSVADLAIANKALANIQAESTVTNRKGAIATAGIKLPSFEERAIARAEDGTFKMSDTDFSTTLSDLKAVATTAAPAAPAAGSPAPGTPAPAVAGVPAVPAAATASVVPAAPDLTGAGMYANATAALMGGSIAPSAQGRAKFSSAFGAEG